MQSLYLKNLSWLLISIVIIIADQVTKRHFNQLLQLGQSIEITTSIELDLSV